MPPDLAFLAMFGDYIGDLTCAGWGFFLESNTGVLWQLTWSQFRTAHQRIDLAPERFEGWRLIALRPPDHA
jgi:hypothetical protein